MPITAEDLAQLSPLTKVQAPGRTSVDLLKIVTALVTAAKALVEGEDDPAEKAEAFGERVDEIDAVVSKAVQDEDGSVYLEDATGDVAKAASEFSVADAQGGDGDGGDGGDDDGEGVGLAKNLDPLEFDEEGMDDVLDDGGWAQDLSPKDPPIMRNARLTKGERPVPGRPGARAGVKKRYADARDEAFGRKPSDRCMQ